MQGITTYQLRRIQTYCVSAHIIVAYYCIRGECCTVAYQNYDTTILRRNVKTLGIHFDVLMIKRYATKWHQNGKIIIQSHFSISPDRYEYHNLFYQSDGILTLLFWNQTPQKFNKLKYKNSILY